MTRMNAIVCRYSSPSGFSRNSCTAHVAADANVMTNMTAAPMPAAVFIFLDTPRNGQIPRNLTTTKLFMNTAEIKAMSILASIIPVPPFHWRQSHS